MVATSGRQAGQAPSESLGLAAVESFFRRYEREFNQGLAGALDLPALTGLYAEAFIASAPAGVMAGHNDAELARVTTEGFQRYRDLGMTRMALEGVAVSSIDALHALVHTTWYAVYAVEGGEKSIGFVNAYLVRTDVNGGLKVFGWITGDEEEAMREHGITSQPAKSRGPAR